MKSFHLTPYVLALCVGLSSLGFSAQGEDIRLKEFLVMGYQGIQNELSSTHGPYINTLFDLLHLKEPAEQSAALDHLRSLSKTYPNIMDFADHAMKLQTTTKDPEVANAVAPTAELPPLPTSSKLFAGDSLENALKHLGKGMKVTVYLKTGETIIGTVSDYDAGRLSLRTPASKSFRREDIRGLEAPNL